MKVKAPFANSYCGNGKLKACQTAIWDAIAASGSELAGEVRDAGPVALALGRRPRADLSSRPACSTTTMRYANRPSGIQQVISFDGHR